MTFAGLQNGASVEGHARVVSSSLEYTKSGDPYWRLTLADKAGIQIQAVAWNRFGEPPEPRCVVRFKATVKDFRDSLNLTLIVCEPDSSVDAEDYLPHYPKARRATPADLDLLVAQIADSPLRQLVELCLSDGERERFERHPAAMKMHGAVAGGLLAHTVRVTRIALSIAEITQAPVERALLITGALLHDLGKLDELTAAPGEEPTEAGRLLGHIVPGLVRISSAAALVPELTVDRLQAVLHIVSASHGKREYGSPITPQTLEALLVSLADDAEAKADVAITAIEAAPPGASWTEYVKSLDARLLMPPR